MMGMHFPSEKYGDRLSASQNGEAAQKAAGGFLIENKCA
jgi:hypothetical protein